MPPPATLGDDTRVSLATKPIVEEARDHQRVDTGRVKLYKISTVKTGEKSFSPVCLSSD
jgi:hypothetical protein